MFSGIGVGGITGATPGRAGCLGHLGPSDQSLSFEMSASCGTLMLLRPRAGALGWQCFHSLAAFLGSCCLCSARGAAPGRWLPSTESLACGPPRRSSLKVRAQVHRQACSPQMTILRRVLSPCLPSRRIVENGQERVEVEEDGQLKSLTAKW